MSEIVRAETAADLAAVRTLFQEYVEDLDFELDFQDFDAELDDFPGKYGPPSGVLLLAKLHDKPVGAVGLRDLGDGICEMKRLFLRPAARGTGLGVRLVDAIIAQGRRLGYRAMRLDTVTDAQPQAIRIYLARGFQEIEPYCFNPLPGAKFLELDLDLR